MADDKEILTFKIDAWTPETIPMARLAEYMRLVAALYGEQGEVHSRRLKKGSAVLESTVAREAFPKVVTRLQALKTMTPPEDLAKTFEQIDDLLRSDNAVGTVSRPKGGKILEFPGRKAPKPEAMSLTQPTTVDGVVMRVGGIDETIPVVLVDNDRVVYRCTIRGRERARELAKYLYGAPIRVSGTGKWIRNTDGRWELDHLLVASFEELDDKPLDEVVNELRAMAKGQWNADSLKRWKRDREG